jgi:hypothetical protein
MNPDYLRATFFNVLLTLIFIYLIRWVSLKYEIPFMKQVVTYQVPTTGGI